jgi:F-type H+-transporting ATPase subunit epsilon
LLEPNRLKLEIVTLEQVIFSGKISSVTAPGAIGELCILPGHCPLVTMLLPGELRINQDGRETSLVIGGGFLEVKPDRIIILADAAERSEQIDIQKAEEAKRRAEQKLNGGQLPEIDRAAIEAGLRFEVARLKMVEKRKKKKQLLNP